MMTTEDLESRYHSADLEKLRVQLSGLSEQLEYENYKLLVLRDNFMKVKDEYLKKLGVADDKSVQ